MVPRAGQGAGCLVRAGTARPAAAAGGRGREATLLAVALASLSKQHPVLRPRRDRRRGQAAEALRGRGADPRPTQALWVVATPRVTPRVATGHASSVMELPPKAGSFQRQEHAVRRTDPPCTAVPRRLPRARRQEVAGRRPKRRPGNEVGPEWGRGGLTDQGFCQTGPNSGRNLIHTYLHYITLYYITLHYTTLHYIT